MNTTTPNNSQFLADLTDGRDKGDWHSRYDEFAQIQIKKERNYLLVVLLGGFVLTFLLGLYFDSCLFSSMYCFDNVKYYIFSFFGGTLGGAIFSLKWLVHSVAKNTWNMDRHLWRIMTPILSSAIALLFFVLLNTDIFTIETAKCSSIYKAYGIGALVGYFSDNAIGKLTEIAQVLFGSSNAKSK